MPEPKKKKMRFIKSFILLSILLITTTSVYSQFGKNRVQYQEFEWKFVETKHFDIYFHQGGEYLAKFAAIEAERALLSIEDNLKYDLKRRISFIVFNSHNQFQQNNIINSFLSENVGGVTQLFKNRIVVPFQGSYTQFRHVIHHELVHGVVNDLFHGGTLQSSLANQGYFIPGWLNEGLCEYLSNKGMDTKTDMFMRDVTISEELPLLQRISGYAQYRVGQTFYWYIADKYGEEKVADFINRLNIHKNLEIAFKSSFDMDLKEFNEMWERDIKRIYWPDLDKFKALAEIAKRVTDREKMQNFYNSAPSISPDGRKMAFISEEDGVFVVAVMDDLDDIKTIRPLVSSFRKQDFEDLNMLSPGISWNPAGTQLAISAKAGGQDAIFITDVETGAYKKLTWGIKAIQSVQWSPDGTKLAFIGSVDEETDIFTYEFETKELLKVTDDVFSDDTPKWSPDSKSIYFISDRGEITNPKLSSSEIDMWDYDYQKSDIYKINIETKEVVRLTTDSKNGKTSLAISSDDSKMLYVSDKNGIGNLYEMNLSDKTSRPLTNSLQEITQVSLAKDDSKVLFGSQIKGGYDIFSIEYPFERKLDVDVLPLTTFKKSIYIKDSLITAISKIKPDTAKVEEEQLISYGDFKVDFDNQELIRPNDKVQNITSSKDTTLDRNFKIKDYKLKFSPDIILANPGYSTFFGVQGSAQMLFSDELGNHQLYFQANLLIDLRNSNFFGSYSYLPGIIDYQFSAFHNVGFAFRSQFSLERFRSYGGAVSAQYPFDLFNRAELNMTFYNLSRDEVTTAGVPSLTRTLVVPEFRYVHDDVLFGLYGPRVGTRYNFRALASPNVFSDGLSFYTFETDIRTYYPVSDYMGFAFKFTGGASFGKNAQSFYIGGTDNWINRSFGGNGSLPFDGPEDFAFMNFKYPMRGFSIAQMGGNKFFLTNAEFRFPLLTALIAGPLPILIQGVMGSLFLDVGAAWDDNFNPTKVVDPVKFTKEYDDLLISSGFGIRSYFLGLPVKVDIAWTKSYSNWSTPQYIFSLGYDF